MRTFLYRTLCTSLFFWVISTPSFAQLQCSEIYSEKNTIQEGFISSIWESLGLREQLGQVVAKIQQSEQRESAIPITKKMQEFRDEYLPMLKLNAEFREGLIRFMEAKMRIRSARLNQAFQKRKEVEYDFVIRGAGPHGIVALQSLLAINPQFRILIIDKNDTAGATFRLAGESFRINSSSRPSGETPLPGLGNINELPGFPIQLPDITSVKYPTSGNLGDVVVTGLYSAVSKHPNVDVLFNATAGEAQIKGGRYPTKTEVTLNETGDVLRVSSQKAINAVGLGIPKTPGTVRESLREFPELTRLTPQRKKLPRVIQFEDLLRILAQDSNPRRFFENQNVAVTGKGDSANVIIEFLLGYGPNRGYGLSDAQTSGAKRITWVGQTIRTCEAFIAEARSRYAQIGTGFRSSSPEKEPPLVGEPARLVSVEPKSARSSKVLAELEGGRVSEFDVIILATGFENKLVESFRSFLPKEVRNEPITTQEFFEQYTSFLTAKTTVSEGQNVRVASIIPSGAAKDAKFIGVGPGGGKFPKDTELVGIIQNFVSLFNNAPRTYAAAAKIAKGVEPIARPINTPEINSRTLEKDPITVTGFEPIRSVGEFTEAYIKYSFVEALKTLYGPNYKGEMSIEVALKNGKLVVSSKEGFPGLMKLTEALTEARDFYNTVFSFLNVTEFQTMNIKVNWDGQFISRDSVTIDFTTIESGVVPMRGRAIENNGVSFSPTITN